MDGVCDMMGCDQQQAGYISVYNNIRHIQMAIKPSRKGEYKTRAVWVIRLGKCNWIVCMLILILCLVSQVSTQQLMVLYPSKLAQDSRPITIFNSSNTPNQNETFTQRSKTFNCSLSPLYVYKQTKTQYLENSLYQIKLTGLPQASAQSAQSPLVISINTIYHTINPKINGTTSVTCASQDCLLFIDNGCSPQLNRINNYDTIVLNLSTFNYTIEYNVECDMTHKGTSFQFGLLIQIIFSAIAITITAIYSNAWSISGRGIVINWFIILLFNIVITVGAIIAYFYYIIVQVTANVLSWGFGFAGVWLCANQLIYLLKAVSILRKQLFKFSTHSVCVRVMDVASAVIGVGVCLAWWYSNKNWIINDIIAVCMIVGAIKVFKFTSLKWAVICFIVTISVQIVFILFTFLKIKQDYNNVVLNMFNNPFQLQLPTINPVYNQKCAWLPITSIIYPGALMSYMRRFDTSRNTNVYIITCVSVFFLGSLIWMFMSIGTLHQWPYGLIAEPATLGLVALFAWKRKQIRTLWTGKFYDQEFANKDGLRAISQSISRQRRHTEITYTPDMFSGLQAKQDSQMEKSQIVHQIQMAKLEHKPNIKAISEIPNSSFSDSNNLSYENASEESAIPKTISISSDGQSQRQLLQSNRIRLVSDEIQLIQKQSKISLFNKKDSI